MSECSDTPCFHPAARPNLVGGYFAAVAMSSLAGDCERLCGLQWELSWDHLVGGWWGFPHLVETFSYFITVGMMLKIFCA